MNIAAPRVPGRTHEVILPVFETTRRLIEQWRPTDPVYCLFPHVLHRDAQRFVQGFPGPSLYAVKSNPSPHVIRRLAASGIRHFDTASIEEIRTVRELVADSKCYFMAPVKLKGAAAEAYHEYGVRDFVIDCEAELTKILAETGARDLTIYVRLATAKGDAVLDLSRKFGATPDEGVDLLRAVRAAGCRAAVSFHVGSLCLSPEAYVRAMALAADVVRRSGVTVVAVNVGGGFPTPYPPVTVPPIDTYFTAITTAFEQAAFAGNPRLMCEPGRALSAECMSIVTQVIRRKGDMVYLNDGIYGSFVETTQLKPMIEFPPRTYRLVGDEVRDVTGPGSAFRTFGPTCDSVDVLPWDPVLPSDIEEGDFVEFGMAGAYTVATRTRFNGFFPETFAVIGNRDSAPPGVEL